MAKPWYHSEYDKGIANLVSSNNIPALRDALHRFGKDNGQKYFSELRCDPDGLATDIYQEDSGWSLLNIAANKGLPDMVKFLVSEAGMDIDTICYGVTPIFCCFPSIHDEENSPKNFNQGRLEAAQAFISLGANTTHQSNIFKTGIVNSACQIVDDELRQKAVELLVQEARQACRLKDAFGSSAFHSLFKTTMGDKKTYQQLEPQARLLLKAGVSLEPNNYNQPPEHFLARAEDKQKFRALVESCKDQEPSPNTYAREDEYYIDDDGVSDKPDNCRLS